MIQFEFIVLRGRLHELVSDRFSKRSSRKLRNWDATHGRPQLNFSEIIFSVFIVILHLPFPGQITQWNLIFYGTNDPPQQSDPDRLGKKKTVNDLVHNSLENSQWGFITQDVSISFMSLLNMRLMALAIKKPSHFSWISLLAQVTDADAHLDVQRTVDGDRDRATSSACLRYSAYDKIYCLGLCLFIIILINVCDKRR